MVQLVDKIICYVSLETLDGRLQPPSDKAKRQAIQAKACPVSKWSTREFKFYYAMFAICVPLMFKAAMEASNETNPNYPRYAHLLSKGWIFNRKVDNSDLQYRFFRDNFFLIFGLIIIHCSLRRIVGAFVHLKRTHFDFVFGLAFLYTAHGTNSLRILIHLLISYAIAKKIPNHKVATYLTWIYGILSLFLNAQFRSMPFGIAAIDNGFKGIIARWDVFFNFTMLRMISFNLDYLEKANEAQERVKEDKHTEGQQLIDLDERQRLTAPLPLSDYSIVNYIAYITYAPLFIAGPIITFNEYVYQSNYQQLATVKNYKNTFLYFIRFIFCVLLMEFLLHYTYVVAVSKTKSWAGDTPFQISMIGLFNLNIIWLKLLIPWRLFRFWSLLDGIDPPENMIRCVDNNYSALAFWRAWHRSYNRWIIRYIYVPMGGGGSNRLLNSLFVFSFVAIWHDIELRLLMWGWMIVVFLLPEIIATSLSRKFSQKWWYNYYCGVGAVINIWMMMLANLFGFCLGKDGVLHLLHDMFSTNSGLIFLVISSVALFIATQVMFELRESEKRVGVDVKC